MDYDYGQSERQFESEENEEYEETRHQYRQQREEEIGANQSSLSSSSSAGKLFVGGLSWDTTEETFSSYFSKYGEITDAVIMIDRNTGRPRGFGFITFSDPAAAERALEDEHVIDGRTVEVKRTVPKGDMEGKAIVRAKKIFIGGIPPSLTEDELKEYFSPYGSIVDHQIMLDHNTGRSRGFGFVTFESEDAVEQIFSEGKTHELGGKQVEIKKAEPKRPGSGSVGGGDYGSALKPYGGGYNNRSSGYGASHSSGNQYGGKMGRGYESYSNYNAYGGYGGSYPGNAASFYGGYGGGYGFGYGYGGAMMYGAGGYGGGGYGNPSAYGSNAAGYAGGKGYGKNGENGSFAAGKGYGYGNGVGGGYGASSNGGGSSGGGGGAGSAPGAGRYHPYRK